MKPDKTSFVIATGVVASTVKYQSDNAAFTLRNTDGVILVKVPRHLVPQLRKNAPVSVVGYLASFHSRCGAQLFLCATVILTASYPRLWDDIGVPALLRTIYALEKETS